MGKWFGPQTGDCSCCVSDCVVCADCCTDAMPASLDITFGTGWTEPTIDSGKMGCEDAYTDSCADNLNGRTFNLTSVPPSTGGLCIDEGGIALSGFCYYRYLGSLFCPTGTDLCTAGDADMTLWAYFICQASGLCRINVKMEICANCGPIGPWKSGLSTWYWKTADFARGGEVCSGLSKVAPWWSYANYGYADSEGFCLWSATFANRALTIDDGG